MNKEINRLPLNRKWFEQESTKSKKNLIHLSQLCFSLELMKYIDNNEKTEELRKMRKETMQAIEEKRSNFEKHVRKKEKLEKDLNDYRW